MSVKDKLAIREVIAQYPYTYDSQGAEGFAPLFVEDGVFEVFVPATTTAAVRRQSQTAIHAWVAQRLHARRGQCTSRHYQSGTLFDTLTSDVARTRAMVLVTHQGVADVAPRPTPSAEYHDHRRRLPTGWRLAHRAAYVDPRSWMVPIGAADAGHAVSDSQEMTMDSWNVLPQVVLQSAGPVSTAFIARGLTDFRAAGRYLQGLPYGRPVDRADFRAVLREGKGTCSTKHALLAALAHEQNLPVVLTLGLYAMHERNTPGVGPVLTRYGLASLPEAHCYLTYAGRHIDITRSGAEPTEPITQLLYEEAIVPEQIGDYKVTLHRQYMQTWVNNNAEEVRGRIFEEVWQIREECIAALAQ